MTTSLETLCRQVEQESAAATAGPWVRRDSGDKQQYVIAENGSWVANTLHGNDVSNATFIATARDFAPKAARALRLAEAALRQIVGKPNHTNEPLVGSQAIASDALASILAQFEQPKENA